eukprot:CAMPEP_0196579436 /NCGR_PEP_ID=MMETSP1081-20130531/21999_1 /TAXON_ID=36882 /ORGANISM="Pyramimonas amylifera, Strain CCMP720" /LENGTH=143 /DNA_ID=CAMNT_0041899035 /DNA_START=64 /DNA_END=496 /DNA_ORIENTATION=-
MSVQEWKNRKLERAEDPLQELRARISSAFDKNPSEDCSSQLVEARAFGVIIAKSHKTQNVNQRYYFPIEDCKLSHFGALRKDGDEQGASNCGTTWSNSKAFPVSRTEPGAIQNHLLVGRTSRIMSLLQQGKELKSGLFDLNLL